MRRSLLMLGCALLVTYATPRWGQLEPPPTLRKALMTPAHSGHWIYDRAGQLLRVIPTSRGDTASLKETQRALYVPLGQLSPWLTESLICLEDQSFRTHRGVPWRGVARAVWVNARRGKLSVGGSGITQQLVKLYSRRARDLTEKLREARWAWWVDAHLSKSAQLERYLNRAPFGHNLRGVWLASWTYLGVAPSQLSVAQAAYLASIPHAPTRLDPLRAPRALHLRQRAAIRCLAGQGLISPIEMRAALEEEVSARFHAPPFSAPHLIESLLKRGSHFSASGDLMRSSEHNTETSKTTLTIDLALQRTAEQIVARYMIGETGRDVRQVATVALRADGEALFWVGSRGYRHPDAGQVDHVLGARQPGSTLKPLLYALALDRGFKLDQLIPDRPLYFRTPSGHYKPTNYNHQTRGEVTLMSALAQSLNIPSVWLLNQLGVDALLNVLRRAGLSTLNEDASHYGLGLSLGDGDVNLIDLVNAYRGLAQGGIYTPWRVTRAPSRPPRAPRRFASEASSQAILQVLSNQALRAPSFGALTPLNRPYPAFAKTGTSQGYTNAWTVGGTSRHIVGVWVLPRRGVERSGAELAAPLWAQLIDLLELDETHHSPLPSSALTTDQRALLAPLARQEHADHINSAAPAWIRDLTPQTSSPSEDPMSLRALAEPPAMFPPNDTRAQVTSPTASRLEIITPPDLSVYRRLPEIEAQHARLKVTARLDAPLLEQLRRGALQIKWWYNHKPLDQPPRATSLWINPWVDIRETHRLCARVVPAHYSTRDAEERAPIASDCVRFATPRAH